MYLSLLAAFSQQAPDTSYKSRKLSIDETNFVSSYYSQNGSHAASKPGQLKLV